MHPSETIARVGGEEQVEAAFLSAPKAGPDQPEVAGRLLACLAVVGRMNQDDEDMEQALELTAAGWEVQTPPPRATPPRNIWEQTAVMSWKWRRPSRRPGKPGRLFLSTNQAFRALEREKNEAS
jgi:hypothetical protein